MADELTLEIIDEAIKKTKHLHPYPTIKRIRISYGDYRRLREASDFFKICPEQLGGYTLGFCGEWIMPDINVADNHYEIDWGNEVESDIEL